MKARRAALLLLILAVFLPSAALANAPLPPTVWAMGIVIEQAQAYGAVYADMLVREKAIQSRYVDVSTTIAAYGLPTDCDLVTYRDADGFVSFAAHTESDAVGFCLNDNGNERTIQDTELRGITTFKVAVFDADGKLLRVSEEATLSTVFTYYNYYRPENKVRYDLASGEVTVPMQSTPRTSMGFVYLLFCAPLCWIMTLVVELIVAAIMKMKPIAFVLPINAASNLLFNIMLLSFDFDSLWAYAAVVAVGEAVVIGLEFLVYRRFYGKRGIPRRKVFQYTWIANAASCLIGVTFNALILL